LEAGELARAHKTIAEFEIIKAAVARFDSEEPFSPKGGARSLKA
jgi:hypothetical protein